MLLRGCLYLPSPFVLMTKARSSTVKSQRVVDTPEAVEANTLSEGPKNKYERLESRISALNVRLPHPDDSLKAMQMNWRLY